jgi:hypothetical protein
MELNLKIKISREVLENIFVTALEGASDYWCSISEESRFRVRAVVPKSVEPATSVAIFKAVYDFGIPVNIVDAEDEEQEIGTLSIVTMHDRLQSLLDTSTMRDYLMREIAEDGDGESSDVVFQYMALGEVIYG